MATAAQAQPNEVQPTELQPSNTQPPAPTDPVERWLARRVLNPGEQRAATNRANSANRRNSLHSTGPRTESGKQRSSRNALTHGLTARTAVLPTEDPAAHQLHIQQFLDEHKPATPTETELVHEMADSSWRLKRIQFLEADLFAKDPNPEVLIPLLAKLGLHGSRLSRPFEKALKQLREIQEERLAQERRQLTEAAELLLLHEHKGLPWNPADHSFVFSPEQIERQAKKLVRLKPQFYAPLARVQADPLTRTAR